MTQPWNKLTERDRDKLVAEKVMGWIWWKAGTIQQLLPPNENWPKGKNFERLESKVSDLEDWTDTSCFKPSTYISAAMEVLERFENWRIHKGKINLTPSFEVRILKDDELGNWETGDGFTLPEAICKAALCAKGIEV